MFKAKTYDDVPVCSMHIFFHDPVFGDLSSAILLCQNAIIISNYAHIEEAVC